MINYKLKWVFDNTELSRPEIADKLGVSRQTLYNWEYGIVSMPLTRYLNVLKCVGISENRVPDDPSGFYPEWHNHTCKRAKKPRCMSDRIRSRMKPGEIRWIPEHYKQRLNGPMVLVKGYYHIKDYEGRFSIAPTEELAKAKLAQFKAERDGQVDQHGGCDLI